MSTLLRRWRILTTAERVIRVLHMVLLFQTTLQVARAVFMFWKRKGR